MVRNALVITAKTIMAPVNQSVQYVLIPIYVRDGATMASSNAPNAEPVSYTHLDVYKRQGFIRIPMCQTLITKVYLPISLSVM